MDLLKKNPFTTIKANDLNDSEINEQWVDNPHGGFIGFFSPTDKVSQYILGGKGSGKTHLMRYFSYNAQCIRNSSHILSGISKDKYFGIYFQASGLNGERFEKLPFNEYKKHALFQYSYELWCSGLVIQSLIDVNEKENIFEKQKDFCLDVLNLFSKRTGDFEKVDDLYSLKNLISSLSNEVDYAVNNAFFINDIDVEVLASRGTLIFGIPKLLSKYSSSFKGVTFLYLIDELENISESQQIYINTLLREKKLPCSFRIGARGYGIKTFKTLGGGEENRQGHEYEILKLDDLLSNISDYEKFAVDLIINRLERSGFHTKNKQRSEIFDSDHIKKKEFLESFFETPNFSGIINSSNIDSSMVSKKISNFQSKLIRAKVEENPTKLIISNLSENRNQIVEFAIVHIFSNYWSTKNKTVDDLVRYSAELRVMADAYIANPSETSSLVYKKIDYYNNNYLGSLLRSKSQNNMEQYLGLDNLLKATTGFPRHILTVLRNIYKTEIFEGREPFSGSDVISIKSQRISLLEASNWFYNECGCEGLLGSKVSYFLNNICELLRLEMYADKPAECSASSFTVDKTKLTEESREILKWAELTRVLIKGKDRQEKNSQAMIDKYHINSLLCPKWGLPVSRRGALSFMPEDFESLLRVSLQSEYESFRSKFESSRYAPFIIKGDSPKTSQLNMEF